MSVIRRLRDWWWDPFADVAAESFSWLEQHGFTRRTRRAGHAEVLEYQRDGEEIVVMAEPATSGGMWVAVKRDGDRGYVAQAVVEPRGRDRYREALTRLSDELKRVENG